MVDSFQVARKDLGPDIGDAARPIHRPRRVLDFGWARGGVRKRFSGSNIDECVLTSIFILVP